MLRRIRDALGVLFRPPRPLSGRVVRRFEARTGMMYLRLVDEDGAEISTEGGVDALTGSFVHRNRRVRLDERTRSALGEIAAAGYVRGGPRGFAIREEDAVDVSRGLEAAGVSVEAAADSDPFAFDARPLEVRQSAELVGDDSLESTVVFASADGTAAIAPANVAAQSDRTWIRTEAGFQKRPNLTRDEVEEVVREAAKPVLDGDDVPYFLAKALADAKRQGRQIILGPRAAAARIIDNDWLPRASIDVRGERLHIDVDMIAGDVSIPLREAEQAKKRRYVRARGAKDTWLRNDRAAQKKARDALSHVPDLKELPGTRGFDAPAYALPVVQEQFAEIGRVDLSEAASRLFGQLHDFTQIESVPQPSGLRAELRDYQRKGLDWLCFLRRYGFSGILADDMGLGKTLQTCSALLAAADAGQTGASLVVCPASVVAVWESEIRKWCSGLTPVVLTPATRTKYLASPPPKTVAITSYQAVARRMEPFQRIVWNYVILDEAHRVKNHQTAMAQACKGLLAHHKVALTGTPIQNRLLELWAIYDSIMPGYLGDVRDFGRRFEKPIQKDQDESAAERLRKRIDPFKLRRLKSQVAKDLPPFTRELRSVPLVDYQRKLYAKISDELRLPDVLASLRGRGDALKGLEKLLRLRQVCAHPRLLDRAAPLRDSSGKFEEFADLLEQSLDGDHKVLVFTQWTGMAAIIRELLAELSVPHAYLDGSLTIPARKDIVADFQRTDGPRVMVVSLLAGGEGITLTQADTVIMYDRWWNPAIEEQAFARAYRIGQTRPVTAYVLQSANTIEEKLANLLEDKRELAEDLVRVDAFEKRITRDQLIALLEEELASSTTSELMAAQ